MSVMKKKKVSLGCHLKTSCETCGAYSGLTISHFVKENSVAKTKRDQYDYSDPKNFMTQCLTCHMKYEKLPVHNKFCIKTRFDKVQTRQEYLISKNLNDYAKRVKELITL